MKPWLVLVLMTLISLGLAIMVYYVDIVLGAIWTARATINTAMYPTAVLKGVHLVGKVHLDPNDALVWDNGRIRLVDNYATDNAVHLVGFPVNKTWVRLEGNTTIEVAVAANDVALVLEAWDYRYHVTVYSDFELGSAINFTDTENYVVVPSYTDSTRIAVLFPPDTCIDIMNYTVMSTPIEYCNYNSTYGELVLKPYPYKITLVNKPTIYTGVATTFKAIKYIIAIIPAVIGIVYYMHTRER